MLTKDSNIPIEIENALAKNRLVIFIGASVSRILGSPSWEDLSKKLLESALRNSKNKKEVAEYYSKNESNFPRKTITIAKALFYENDNKEEYNSLFKKLLCSTKNSRNEYKIYNVLKSFPVLFFTLNADLHFEKEIPNKDNIFAPPLKLENLKFPPLKLVHLHGRVDQPHTLIYTIEDYIRFYIRKDEKVKIDEVLTRIFSDNIVLFIGYGLTELELLQFCLKEKNSNTRHFALKLYSEDNKFIEKYDSLYYESLGIRLISYLKCSSLNYATLYYILKKWQECLIPATKPNLESQEQIQDLAKSKFTVEKGKLVLNLVKDNPSLRNDFLETSYSVSWINFISENNWIL